MSVEEIKVSDHCIRNVVSAATLGQTRVCGGFRIHNFRDHQQAVAPASTFVPQRTLI